MAVIPAAHKALKKYHERIAESGEVENLTIREAVILTLAQQQAITTALTSYWKRQYLCPKIIDIKPRHGYESRVLKDGFSGEQYIEWLVAGCADVADVATDHQGRPRLVVVGIKDHHSTIYDIVVPVQSDAHGRVHISGMIPTGLEPRKKKQLPRHSLRPSD